MPRIRGALHIYFNPLPSREGRPVRICSTFGASGRFQSTPLTRGETRYAVNDVLGLVISIHSPHARGDQYFLAFLAALLISIHSPHARGDEAACAALGNWESISIHSPHARGDYTRSKAELWLDISIHSPHARGDALLLVFNLHLLQISIHSPHARGDVLMVMIRLQL